MWPNGRSRFLMIAAATALGLAGCSSTPGPTNPVNNPNANG